MKKTKLSRIFKKQKVFLKSISLTLIIALLLTSIPFGGIFVSAEQSAKEPEVISVIMELVQYRTEFSKTYLKSDGTLESVVSSNAIHFKEDGEWVEIDSSLETTENENGEEILQNKQGKFNVEFPTEIEDNSEIAVEKGKNKISIKLLETKKSKAQKNTERKQKAHKLTKERRRTMTAGELFEVDNNQTSTLEYSSVYSDTDIRYDVTPNEVKESIVLTETPNKKPTYSYEITTNGLTAVLNKDSSIDFFEKGTKDSDPVFSMPAPHMFDSNDEYSYDIKTSLKNKNGKYILTYKPDYNWLKSQDRTYPVTIDPTVTINSGIQDSYTFSGEGYGDSYTGYEQQLKVGTTSWITPNDYWQTYLKFTDLPQIPYDSYRIDSAYLTLSPKATTGGWEEMELGVYELTEDWKNHQTGKVAERITFNNAPEDVGYSTATASVSRGGADNGVVVGFEIAHLVEKWYNNPETNFGVKLAAHLDESQYNDNLVFHSSRSTTGTAPYLSLMYTEYVPVERVEITGKQERLEYLRTGNAFEVSAIAYPENANNNEIVWESTNENTAYYNDGYIWASGIGTTTITARSADNNEIFDSFELEVYNIPIDTLTITNCPEDDSLEIGQTHQLDFEVGPDNATDKEFVESYSSYINWSSSDDDVISVDSQGVLTANSTGTAIIYAAYGDVIDTVTLNVPVTKAIAVDFASGSSISSLCVGDSIEFSGLVLPLEATDKRTICISLNPEVVSVVSISDTSSPDKSVTYRLTALSPGTATIRLKAYNDSSVYKEITVNVTKPEYVYNFNKPNGNFFVVGDTYQLIDIASAEYISSIEDPTIISNDGNGQITALKVGTTKIYIGTYAYDGIEAYEYTVTVMAPMEWHLCQNDIIYCGKSYLLTNDSNMYLSTTDTDKVQINGTSITALEVGVVTIDACYQGGVLSSIDLHIFEGLCIELIPTNNTINAGTEYERLTTTALQKYVEEDGEESEDCVKIPCIAEWSSSDENIATVYYDPAKNHVILTGINKGKVWISAHSTDPVGDETGFWLTVSGIDVEYFGIDSHTANIADERLLVGETGELILDVYPKDPPAYYTDVEWIVSGDVGCVKLKKLNKTTVSVEAIGVGEVEIDAKIGEKTANCPFVLSVVAPSAIIKAPTSKIIKTGDEYTFKYDISLNATNVTWTSSAPNIANFENKSEPTLSTYTNGEITVSLHYKVDEFTYTHSLDLLISNVVITNVPGNRILFVDGKRDLNAKVYLNNSTSENVIWSTNKPGVAGVGGTGEIVGESAGTVTITAKYANDSDQKAWITLNVKKTKSYLFYLNTKQDNWQKNNKLYRKLIADEFYGGKIEGNFSMIELKSAKSFCSNWNNMGKDCEIGYVLIDCHADDYDFDGLPNSDTISADDICAKYDENISDQLYFEKKEMCGLISLGCNSGHLDHKETNLASALAQKVCGAPVMASDGTVRFWDLGDLEIEDANDCNKKFCSLADDSFLALCVETEGQKRTNNRGWMIYKRFGNRTKIIDVKEKEKDEAGNITGLFLVDMIEILSHY